jgi:hypothetical protein
MRSIASNAKKPLRWPFITYINYIDVTITK